MKNFLSIGVLIVLLFAVTGCEQALNIGSASSPGVNPSITETGTLTISGKEPDGEILTVSGVSDTGQIMELRSIGADSKGTFDLIPPGNWTIYYNYSDKDGRVLSYGSDAVRIHGGRHSFLESKAVGVTCLPGDSGFIKGTLQEWFEPIFIKYEIDSYGRGYAHFIRNMTYLTVHRLLGNSRSLTVRKVWLEKNGIEPNEIIKLFIDGMLLFDRGAFMVDMINEILAIYQNNMYHYFNILVPFLVDFEIDGLPQDLILKENSEFVLAAQPLVSSFDYLWTLNGDVMASGDEWTLLGSLGVIGTNQLILQASYRGVVLGRSKAVLLKEESNNRLLLTNVPFVSDSLRTLVLSTGLTYADELTTLVVRDYLNIDLGGLEKLENLQTLYLVNLGLVSLSDVQPVLDLLSVGNLINLRVVNNPLDPSAKAALESLFPGCVQ